MSYVTPSQDITYNDLNHFTAYKIYEIVKETEDTIFVLNDIGVIDELHKSLIRGKYPTYRIAVIHNNLFLWIFYNFVESMWQTMLKRKRLNDINN
ncbi:hypothetical protein [Paenibacillus oryzisoli]|uniref:Uncharacterized protein n=1 Tax=Paenibacillus oryzisoli TaxID=1850517 RepID=A0A198A4R1_9BACL|nr:hypothetical protein [Paenibacillus oryzisoli]OAS16031.1 hypothetical protein A8708_05485 [Paenibacillus oryzisoli]